MQHDPRYERVRAALPESLPPITRVEAERAARRLFRHFGAVALGGPLMRYPAKFNGRVRRCWISTKPTEGHLKGWGRLVHDVSHSIFRRRHPNFRPHAGGHATLEAEIAAFVVKQGWLEGTLQPKKSIVTSDEKRIARLAKIDAAMKRWRTKQKRAANALRKLERRRRATVRALNLLSGATNSSERATRAARNAETCVL